MTIEINVSMTFHELAELFGLSVSEADALEAHTTLKVSPKNIVIEDNIGACLAVANVKLGVLNMAKNGKLGPATKAMIKGELEQAFSKAAEQIPFFPPPGPDAEVSPYPYEGDLQNPNLKIEVMGKYSKGGLGKVAAIKSLRSLTGLSLKNAKALVEVWIIEAPISVDFGNNGVELKPEASAFNPKKSKVKSKVKSKGATTKIKEGVMNQDKVPLCNAENVFQPVGGSGGASVYFAIAIGPTVNVGCRVRDTGYTSIRVEGPGLSDPEVMAQLEAAGLQPAGDSHWSLHLDIPNDGLIKKTIGAVLFSMGLPFDQMTTDVKQIMGKGI